MKEVPAVPIVPEVPSVPITIGTFERLELF
jgi:hypothetical protein